MKGITPVIAIILLLLITISMVGFAFVWFSRVTSTSAQGIETQASQIVQQGGARASIEAVSLNRVTLRNSGTVPITQPVFYVDDTLVNYSGPASVAPQTVGVYSLNDSALIQLNDNATLKVTIPGGNTDQKASDFYTQYLAARWKFDEGVGTTTGDSSKNRNDGTLVGGPTWVAGIFGTALNFPGAAGNYVSHPDSLSLNISGPITISTWIYPNACGSIIDPYGKEIIARQANPNGMWLTIRNSCAIQFGYQYGSGSFVSTNSVTPVVLNQWNLIVATWNGTHVKISINSKGWEGVVGNSNTPGPFNGPFRIGSAYVGEYFSGRIDDVRIYKTERPMTA